MALAPKNIPFSEAFAGFYFYARRKHPIRDQKEKIVNGSTSN